MSIHFESSEKLLHSQAGEQWKKIGVRHHHGICIPLFSLHSAKSCGIGEYLDLIPIIFWCKEIGLDVIQLLPLNDTGLDTSPYSAISAFALHPNYLSISSLPHVELVPDYEEKISKMRYWNDTLGVKHHVVRDLKNSFLLEYVPLVFSSISSTDSYKTFLAQNSWLEPYSLFKTLKDQQLWKKWEDWPIRFKNPSDASYRDLLQEYHTSCRFHIFVQFLCFQQFGEVHRVAEENGVFLKGDIPILISPESADVWFHQEYFLLDDSAGAPPDLYAKDGQNWDFPVYNWEELKKNGYDWWVKRLETAARLFDLYRIDHVVGFFRIWAIPQGKPSREGFFIPADKNAWIPHGEELMEMMLKTTTMLPIGEDLGVVPPEVRDSLRKMGICGTKVIRWERRWDTDGRFIPLNDYPMESMTTVSTHDSDTLQLWWRHSPKDAKLFSEFQGWDYQPFLSLERQEAILRLSHHSSSLFHINLLQEYLALFPELVSGHLTRERINIPGKILEQNWTYRFRPTVEEMIAHEPLKQSLKQML